jgi:hypothetical protein
MLIPAKSPHTDHDPVAQLLAAARLRALEDRLGDPVHVFDLARDDSSAAVLARQIFTRQRGTRLEIQVKKAAWLADASGR